MGRENGKRKPFLWDSHLKTIIDETLTPANYGFFEHLLLGVSRGFTKGTTGLFPAFALTNWVGDQVTGTANTVNNYVPIFDPLHKLSKAIFDKDSANAQYLEEYLILGGERQTFVGWQDLSAEELTAKIENERKGLLKVVDAVNAGLDILAIPSKYSEITTRATEYIKARNVGKSQIVALEQAGRVTAPFHHVGKWGGHFGKTFIKAIPFFNPSIQVLDQTLRTASTPRGRQRLLFVLAAITGAVVTGFGLMTAATDEQKQAYKDLQPAELVKYIWLPNLDGKTLIKIKVQEYGIIGNMINMALSNTMFNAKYGVSDFIDASAQILPEQFNITDPIKAFLSWIPPLIKVPIETFFNVKDFPRIMPIENQYLQSLPPGLRFNEGTSFLAKKIGKLLNLSPIKIDFLITGLFGRTTGFILGKGAAYNPFSGVIRESYFTSGRTLQGYYDLKGMNEQKIKSIKDGLTPATQEEKDVLIFNRDRLNRIEKYLKAYRDLDLFKDKDKAARYREEIVKRINELKPLNKKTSLLEGIVKPALAADEEGFITMDQFGLLEEITKRKQELNKLIKANEKSRLVSPVDVGSLKNELGSLEEERKRIVAKGTTPRSTPSPTPEKKSYLATATPYNNTIKKVFGKNFVDATRVLKRRNDEGKLVGENVALGTDLTTSNEGYDTGKATAEQTSPGDVLGKDGLYHS